MLGTTTLVRGIGCHVQVYERTSGAMTSRGAGIVVQPELLELLTVQRAPPLPVTTCTHRRYLDFSGGQRAMAMAQQIHEEAIGERLWPLGEDAVLGLSEVGIQDSHTANQNRHLGSGQPKHVT